MRTVTHREMRNNSGEILRAVAAGESIQVTNHGQVAAVIIPPPTDRLADLQARGGLRAARRLRSDLASLRRRNSHRSTAELLAESRGEH